MAILDGRTLLSGFETGDTVPTPVDLSGSAGGTADTEIFIQGSRSFGYYSGSTRDGLMYDHGTTRDFGGDIIYAWVNCGIAGLLDTKANGGMAMRFCGNAVGDWFEVNIAGSDIYPTAVNGGWVMLVVSVTEAKTASDRTGGTPPLTSAIRYVGVSTITPSMPRMADNTWVDAMWYLADNQPGIKVEGSNTGSVPWTWQDILDAGDLANSAKAWGTIKRLDNGTIALNTPVRFGADNTTTHLFTDTNETVGFENALIEDPLASAASFYKIQVYGNAGGTTTVEFGEKTGTGDDATGAQGGAFLTGGPLFDLDLAGIGSNNTAGCYGVSIEGARNILCDDTGAEIISCQLNACETADVHNAGAFLRNRILNAATVSGVAFIKTDDLGDIVFCDFSFSAGHAIELEVPRVAVQVSKGNRFTGYGTTGTNDAAIYNNTAGAVAISATSGALVSEHTYRNGTSASTTVTADITITFTTYVIGTEIRVLEAGTNVEADGIETTIAATWDATLSAGVDYDIIAIYPEYIPIRRETQQFGGDQNLNLNQQVDRNYSNP